MIEKSVDGVTDLLFGMLDEVTNHPDMDINKKCKNVDLILRNVWRGAQINIQNKRLMLQAPDIAKDVTNNLVLGSVEK